MSLALLVYAAGSEVTKLLLSLVTIFFSSKHLTPKATQLQETLVALQARAAAALGPQRRAARRPGREGHARAPARQRRWCAT